MKSKLPAAVHSFQMHDSKSLSYTYVVQQSFVTLRVVFLSKTIRPLLHLLRRNDILGIHVVNKLLQRRLCGSIPLGAEPVFCEQRITGIPDSKLKCSRDRWCYVNAQLSRKAQVSTKTRKGLQHFPRRKLLRSDSNVALQPRLGECASDFSQIEGWEVSRRLLEKWMCCSLHNE